jgi:NitT/TauT family transport system substrate-binding protein
MGLGVLLFSEKSLKEKLPLIEKLYRAYWKAAQLINASPNSYRQLLVATAGFPKEAAEVYRFVVYQKPRLPRSEDIQSASAWLIRKGLLTNPIATQNLTDSRAIQGL